MKPLLIALAALGLTAAQAHAADPAEGEWLVQSKDAKVRIGPCHGASTQLCGVIVWIKDPRDETGQIRHDSHNPDAGLQARPIVGLQMIWDFKPAGEGRWEGGRIYDPKVGKTYASKLRIAADGTLKVSGCVVMFCQTQTWTRAS